MNTKDNKIYNVDNAWEKLHRRFEEDGLLNSDNNIKKINFFMIAKIAAIFIIGIFISYLAYYSFIQFPDGNMQIAETFSSKSIKKVELSDGTIIYLNKNSKLYYPEKFAENERLVKVEGEAFFNVKKNPEKAFVIIAKNKRIKVLGTSFNVNTNFKDKKVEVFVKTGKVKFYELGNSQKKLILEPGLVGIIDEKAEKFVNNNPNYISWKTKYFDFSNGEKLSEIINTINKAYGVNIIIEDKEIAKKTHQTIYDNNSLDSILKIICKTYSLSIQKQNNAILLKSK